MPINPNTELIGPARLALLRVKAQLIKGDHPILLYGEPGVGKTTIALQAARNVLGTWCEIGIESLIGNDVTREVVTAWSRSLPYRPMFGLSIKHVDELDCIPREARMSLRGYLDRLNPWTRFIATTNLAPQSIDESLQSRFYAVQVKPCTNAELLDWLCKHCLPPNVARNIAAASRGNVRLARIGADEWRDLQAIDNVCQSLTVSP